MFQGTDQVKFANYLAVKIMGETVFFNSLFSVWARAFKLLRNKELLTLGMRFSKRPNYSKRFFRYDRTLSGLDLVQHPDDCGCAKYK